MTCVKSCAYLQSVAMRMVRESILGMNDQGQFLDQTVTDRINKLSRQKYSHWEKYVNKFWDATEIVLKFSFLKANTTERTNITLNVKFCRLTASISNMSNIYDVYAKKVEQELLDCGN